MSETKPVEPVVEKPQEEKKGLKVRSTPPFRLKDQPVQRHIQFINLKNNFGFVPETIAVEKIQGKNNWIAVHAIITPEEEKMLDEMKKKEEAKVKADLKKKEDKSK